MKVDTSKLKTIKNKYIAEGITSPAMYKRIAKGLYDIIEIDGVKFVVGDYKGDNKPKRGGKR